MGRALDNETAYADIGTHVLGCMRRGAMVWQNLGVEFLEMASHLVGIMHGRAFE